MWQGVTGGVYRTWTTGELPHPPWCINRPEIGTVQRLGWSIDVRVAGRGQVRKDPSAEAPATRPNCTMAEARAVMRAGVEAWVSGDGPALLLNNAGTGTGNHRRTLTARHQVALDRDADDRHNEGKLRSRMQRQADALPERQIDAVAHQRRQPRAVSISAAWTGIISSASGAENREATSSRAPEAMKKTVIRKAGPRPAIRAVICTSWWRAITARTNVPATSASNARHGGRFLGPVDKPRPDADASEQDESHEAGGELVVPGGDAPLLLEMANEALNP